MARGIKKEEKKEKNYKEFNITGPNLNDFKGRVYLEEKKSDKGSRYGLSITVNGMTIKGASLWIPVDESKECAILWPSYKGSDGEYNSYIIFFDEKDRADVTEIANLLGELVND